MTINRKEFLLFSTASLLLGNLGISEYNMKEKVQKSKKLSLENLFKIKSLSPLKDADFSLVYDLFENDSDTNFGKASIKFNKEKRMLDFGIDEFTALAKSYFWIAGIFSEKYSEICNLDNIRFFAEFDEKLKWKNYRENIAIKGPPKIPQHNYELKGNRVTLDEKEILLDKKQVYTPPSAIFEVLNGNLLDDFEMIANEKKFNVKINYRKINDFVIFESRFPDSAIVSFTSLYGILYNNIPISSFMEQKQKETGEKSYIRQELTGIKINSQEIFSI